MASPRWKTSAYLGELRRDRLDDDFAHCLGWFREGGKPSFRGADIRISVEWTLRDMVRRGVISQRDAKRALDRARGRGFSRAAGDLLANAYRQVMNEIEVDGRRNIADSHSATRLALYRINDMIDAQTDLRPYTPWNPGGVFRDGKGDRLGD